MGLHPTEPANLGTNREEQYASIVLSRKSIVRDLLAENEIRRCLRKAEMRVTDALW